MGTKRPCPGGTRKRMVHRNGGSSPCVSSTTARTWLGGITLPAASQMSTGVPPTVTCKPSLPASWSTVMATRREGSPAQGKGASGGGGNGVSTAALGATHACEPAGQGGATEDTHTCDMVGDTSEKEVVTF